MSKEILEVKVAMGLVGVVVFASTGLLAADEWFVNCSRTDGDGSGTSEATAFTTIAVAVEKAVSGLVSPDGKVGVDFAVGGGEPWSRSVRPAGHFG